MQKGTDTRNSLIETAADLFNRQGLRATGINQIISTSGTPRGSLYYHFPGGKEQLACAALRLAAERWRDELQAFMGHKGNSADAVLAAFKALGNRLKQSSFRLGCPVATVSHELDDDDEALREICDEHFRAWERYLVEMLLAEGGERGEAREWAQLILAAIEGGLVLARTRRSTAPLKHAGARVHALLHARAMTHATGAPS